MSENVRVVPDALLHGKESGRLLWWESDVWKQVMTPEEYKDLQVYATFGCAETDAPTGEFLCRHAAYEAYMGELKRQKAKLEGNE